MKVFIILALVGFLVCHTHAGRRHGFGKKRPSSMRGSSIKPSSIRERGIRKLASGVRSSIKDLLRNDPSVSTSILLQRIAILPKPVLAPILKAVLTKTIALTKLRAIPNFRKSFNAALSPNLMDLIHAPYLPFWARKQLALGFGVDPLPVEGKESDYISKFGPLPSRLGGFILKAAASGSGIDSSYGGFSGIDSSYGGFSGIDSSYGGFSGIDSSYDGFSGIDSSYGGFSGIDSSYGGFSGAESSYYGSAV